MGQQPEGQGCATLAIFAILIGAAFFAVQSFMCSPPKAKEPELTRAEEDRIYGPFPKIVESDMAAPVASNLYSRFGDIVPLTASPLYHFSSNGVSGWRQVVRYKCLNNGTPQVREEAFLVRGEKVELCVPVSYSGN